MLVKRSAEGVAIRGEALLHLGARICEECQGRGLWQTAAVCAQELVNLSALVREVLVRGVNGVNNEDDLDGFLAAAECLERGDMLQWSCCRE